MYIDIDIDMEHGHRHAVMDMDMQHGHGHTARFWSCSMDLAMDMHGCQNAHKKFSLASLVWFTTLSPASAFPHRHSGIMVSPVPLVTDQSVSAQLCCGMETQETQLLYVLQPIITQTILPLHPVQCLRQ